ncbi:MAG TPA: metal-dependent hydrolase [Steroidobacteraceae bacterium]|nr:metal-dependent hydrolase [Steroidobacteraceae bacterium]
MQVRTPDIGLGEGPLLWSKIPEFAIAYNGYSVVIPVVEHYLNSIMNRVRKEAGGIDPELADALEIFIDQETQHSKYHVRFNKRMFDEGIEGLKPLMDRMVADLRKQRETKSLAFNVAYCAGFESIATYDAIYIYTQCDRFLEGADPRGANLLLWHVAEEFEHRSVCHDAFQAVSGNYFRRVSTLLYAFWHVGGAFVQAEDLVLAHYRKRMSPEEVKASERISKRLFWRQLRYVAPRMLKILLPWYNPARLPTPQRMHRALQVLAGEAPIRTAVIEQSVQATA